MMKAKTIAACDAGIGALHLGVGDFAASIGAKSEGIGVSPAGYRHKAFGRSGYDTTPLDLFAYPMMRLLVAALGIVGRPAARAGIMGGGWSVRTE